MWDKSEVVTFIKDRILYSWSGDELKLLLIKCNKKIAMD